MHRLSSTIALASQITQMVDIVHRVATYLTYLLWVESRKMLRINLLSIPPTSKQDTEGILQLMLSVR